MILISVGLLFRETSSFDLLCCQMRSEHNSLIVFNRLLVLISPFSYNHKDVPPELSMFPSSRHILAIFVVKNCTHFLHLFRMPHPLRYLHAILSLRRVKLGSECLLVLPPQPSCIHIRQIHIKITSNLPSRHTTVSLVSSCLCIGTFIPTSSTFTSS